MLSIMPQHLGGPKPSLDPYGQLLRMLVPRAVAIGFYDARGEELWSGEHYDGPDPRPVVQEALDKAPSSTTERIDGFSREFEGAPAYAFRLRDDAGRVIAVAVVLVREGESRPYPFMQHLVQPALECLSRELLARSTVGIMSRDLRARDDDLDLLLKVAPEDPDDPQQADELGLLVQTCVDHLDCKLGALVVPERNVALCKAPAGGKPQVAVLTATHRHLLNWAQLQRRTLLVNKVSKALGGLPQVKILSVPVRHASGRVIGFLAMFRETADDDFDLRQERMCELLGRKAGAVLQNNFDAATALLTRPAFELQVRAALTSCPDDAPSCVLYLDADRMHVVNDNFGMHVGDEVIGKIAEVLRRKPRPGALAARIAGDRFAMFLPDCRLESAEQVAESVCRECAGMTYPRGNGTVQVSVSIGVAELAEGPGSLPHALASAEIACKAAKDRGRGRAESFKEADQSIVRRSADVAILQELHDALEHDRFVLFAQPILPLASVGGEPRFELLLRMLGAGGEILPPSKFLSAAERYQLLPRIDRWVVSHALRALKARAGLLCGRGMRFSINVSGPSVGDPSFLGFLEEALQDSGLPPEVIGFELTETAAVSNLARADQLMRRLRALGCSFALDDFGTGLSSLSYLRSLPISTLKIDGSFVRDAASNPRTESMVRAIAQMASTMGMETVAEFVETDELRLRMTALGVDFGQGFAIGQPVPLEEVLGDLALYEVMVEKRA